MRRLCSWRCLVLQCFPEGKKVECEQAAAQIKKLKKIDLNGQE
jgi:hypothetical protein